MARCLLLSALLLVSVACSPEANRTQGGGSGADIGNHSQTVPLHGDGVMFYKTPREGQAITK